MRVGAISKSTIYSTTRQKYLALATAALATLVLGCAPPQPDNGEECYDDHAEQLGGTQHFCNEATSGFWDEYPDSPHHVFVCEYVEDESECDVCSAEDIDGKLADRIREWESNPSLLDPSGCDGEFRNFVRGCGGYLPEKYAENDSGDAGIGACCHSAWYESDCQLGENVSN